MKAHIFFLTFCLALFACSNSTENPPTDSTDTSQVETDAPSSQSSLEQSNPLAADPNIIQAQKLPQTTIMWDAVRHNFGSISRSDSAVFDFSFQNVGEEPLYFTNVIARCGCTVPQWPEEAIAPGERGSIRLIYKPTPNEKGYMEKFAHAFLNDGRQNIQVIKLEGTVKP